MATIDLDARTNRPPREGEAEERSQLDAARADATAEIETVRGVVATELATARQTLEGDARELAREAAGRILGREL